MSPKYPKSYEEVIIRGIERMQEDVLLLEDARLQSQVWCCCHLATMSPEDVQEVAARFSEQVKSSFHSRFPKQNMTSARLPQYAYFKILELGGLCICKDERKRETETLQNEIQRLCLNETVLNAQVLNLQQQGMKCQQATRITQLKRKLVFARRMHIGQQAYKKATMKRLKTSLKHKRRLERTLKQTTATRNSATLINGCQLF